MTIIPHAPAPTEEPDGTGCDLFTWCERHTAVVLSGVVGTRHDGRQTSVQVGEAWVSVALTADEGPDVDNEDDEDLIDWPEPCIELSAEVATSPGRMVWVTTVLDTGQAIDLASRLTSSSWSLATRDEWPGSHLPRGRRVRPRPGRSRCCADRTACLSRTTSGRYPYRS